MHRNNQPLFAKDIEAQWKDAPPSPGNVIRLACLYLGMCDHAPGEHVLDRSGNNVPIKSDSATAFGLCGALLRATAFLGGSDEVLGIVSSALEAHILADMVERGLLSDTSPKPRAIGVHEWDCNNKHEKVLEVLRKAANFCNNATVSYVSQNISKAANASNN